MELGVLGSLQVRQDGAPVAIPGSKPRAILTMLGLHDGSVVPAETLVELLWGHDPPRTAAKALQTHISSLRRALGDGFVLTQGAGWVLAESEVDASRYKSAARLGRDAAAAGDTSQAVARFEEALALWRGVPELPDGRRGTSEKTRWIEGHAALVEDRADALLATGRAAEVIGDLEAAVAEAPLRERRWGQLMLALYRAGRQGEALSAYQRARSLLADELGVDPGPNLRRLEAAIVAQESSLDIAVSQQVPSVTRAVTFLLTDIEGSTAAWEADADAMAVALARHDELVEQVVTSRGGRLIKTRGEGDATFSVFDRPSAAAAAALELQDAIAQEPWALHQPIRVRMALHTGEVELRDGDYFGRAVNRVARLRSLAEGGQILCSGATAELVIDSLADDVMLTDLGLRQLKNLARPEHVFELRLETGAEQLESQAPEAPMMRPGVPAVLVGPGPFVGRGNELDRLLSAWQAALAGGVRTMLIAGEPGVGKTRLAGEWSQRAYDLGAVVLYGRCDEDLGAPYQPFAEALRSLVPCMGADRLRGLRGVEALLSLVPGLADVMPDLARPAHPDPDTERYALFDAVVALLETASKSMPVLLVLDDLHWAAKPTLLLLRHLLRFGDHARIQIVGTYRSTDLDRSHPLAAMLADLHRDGTANRLSLSGLDEDDVTTYVTEAGYDDEDLAHALASVTGGNPFFLIEALRHVDESGGVWDQSTLPQGVREAVSRRLSRLPAETNKALAAAAVVGSRFALELVERVVEDDLIDAFDEACQAGIVIEEPGGYYRFNHAIVRQSLLAELASVRRMRLHQRIATTLEALPGADDELLAELAHHYFECAWAGNAAKAVIYCRRAADQAMTRLAYEGAADLYHHALNALEELDDELPDRDDQTAELLVARCEALLAAGDVASAAGAVSQLQSATIDSARLAAWATCFDGQLSMLIHPERLDEAEAALGAAAAKLAELDDAAGEAKAHTVRAGCLNRLGRIADCEVALDDALTAARRAREHRRVNAVLAGAPLAALWGPNPVPRAGGRCLDVVRLLRITTDSPAVEATSTRCQAVLEAFRGRAAAARRMIDSARRTVTELGLRHALLEVEQFAGIVELIVDDPAAAEAHLRKAYNGFRRMGLDADTAETAALLGRTCLALGRDGEADELCTQSERLAGHALKASIAWRTLRAHLLARGNDHDAARRVAEEAVRLAERTDALVDHADACLTLATVLGAAGDIAGARAAAERAVDLYERKGAAALAEMARVVLGKRVEPTVPTPTKTSAVAHDNACSQAGERMLAAINRRDWEELERLFAPEATGESRRKMVGFSQTDIPSGQWPRLNRRVVETGDVRGSQVVIAVRGERLALARVKLGTSDVSPGAPYDEFLVVYGIDEERRLTLQISFDVDDIDAAIAELDAAQIRLDAEQPPARRLQNLATRVYERFWSCFADRDWDAAAAIVSDGLSGADHRRVVNAGDRGSRETVIEDLKVSADLGFAIWMVDVVAIRGERLALTRVRASGRDPETIQNDALNLIEIGADGSLTSIVVFDLDDIDGAFAELDSRYLAGEAASYSETWSVVVSGYIALNRHEIPPITPDFTNVDHRHGTAHAPGELIDYVRAGWDLGQTIHTYIEAVHRLSGVGAVFTHAAQGMSHEGFGAEWRGISLVTVDGERASRSEVFDEADLDAAIAKFEQLSRPTARLENAAARVFEHVWWHFAARDWDAMAQTVADNYVGIDHRRIVSAETQHGRHDVIRDLQAAADVGFSISMVGAIAIRGERLVLARSRATGTDPDAIQNDALNVFEVDADNRIATVVSYDVEDIDAAIAELDARYLTGEAAAHARAWSAVAGSYAALNRHEPPLTTPDCINVDHRQETAFGPGDVNAYIQAGWDSEQDTNIYVEQVHRLSDVAVVATYAAHETSQEGLRAEWRGIALFAVEDDRINRTEVFDEKDIDAATARFEELNRPTPRLENAASRVVERFLGHFAPRDWAALMAMMADHYLVDDRRRAVNAGIRHGRGAAAEDFRAAAAVGFTDATSTVIATRGTRLTLTRLRFTNRDPRPESFRIETLLVTEIDANEMLAEAVVFELDDFNAAMAELDARYLAGEAATHANTWSAVVGVHAMFNRHEYPPGHWVTIDHRRGSPFAAGNMTSAVHTLFDLTPDFKVHIETVHHLNSAGAVITNNAHGSTPDGLGVEWRMVMLLIVGGDRLTRCEVFDETDSDAAIARLEELRRRMWRLENAASQVTEHFWSCYAVRDWNAMAQSLADEISSHDRRRVVNAGVRRGRDHQLADMRALAEIEANMTVTPIAIRGERLVLDRIRSSNHNLQRGEFGVELLVLAEIDTDERISAHVVFDVDDIDAAFEELDTRYLAGEAAAHAQTWSAIARGYTGVNRHELPDVTPDSVYIDHRAALTTEPEDLDAYLPTVWDLMPDISVYIEAVHRLGEAGAVITHVARGATQEGFEAEWRTINVGTVEGGLMNRIEVYDEEDLDAALARFEELSSPPPALKNAASQAYERICQYLETRDWSALTELCAENVSVDDRRRVVNGGLTTDRDTAIRDLQVAAEIGFSYKLLSVMATRGNRLVLVRVRAVGRDPEAIASDALNMLEVESDGRITADVIFDLDDIDAAFEELENRYLAGEAAVYRHTWSTLLRGFNAFNEHKLPSTTPDWVTIDHRRGRAFSPGELVPYIYATWQVAPQAKIYVDAVHRLNNLGAVVTQSTHGTSSDGFDAEWREVNLMTLDGDLINRCEVFDEEDLETAIVAFDQLCRPAAQLENLASRVTERFLASFAACDWDAVAETLAEDFSQNDRRRVVGAGIRHGRAAEIADLQAIANLGMVNVSSTLIATRGERLVLMRVGFSFRDKGPEAFFGEMLGISEINADERIVAAVSFDRDDIDAAFAELDARYLAGEAAAYAHTWSVVAEANAQFNRHELPATTPDPVYIDHRPLVSIEGVDLATSVGAMWDLASDASAYIEAVHQLNEPGTVVTQVLKMTTQEGFDAELRLTYMIAVEDNLLSRIEVFDESDLDAALARFEELRPRAPRLDNAASQVVERLLAHFGSCQFDLITEILADDSFVDDRRRIINAGRWQGREIVIENMRALAGEATTTSTVLAIRGERLAIARIYFANRNLQQADFGFEMLSVVELDAENRISANIVFDPNDLDAAFRELEMRYLAGEAAAHMNTWSVISQSYAGFNRGEPPATTPDWVMIDRRPLVTSETVDLAASIHGIWDVIPSIYINIEAVHRLSELGAVVTQTIRGTSQEGFDAEWRMIDIYTVDHGLLSRSELFDEADLDAALTRFDELHAQSCQLENAASQADDRFFTCFRARDWEAMAEILAVGSFVDDRRRVVNIGVWHGRDVVITNIRALAEVAPTITSAVTATRGDRVALTHICAPDRDLRHGEFGVEMLGVVEIGTDGRITAHVLFDPDDIDGAFAELDARYLAGEAAAHADTWSVVAGVPARFNRHELPATTPYPVYIDHRPVVSIEDADLAASIRAVWDITSDASVYIEAGHQLSEHGAVFTEVLKMTSQEGFDAEVRMIMMFTVEGGLISRVEVFDEADLDTALTRFDDLHSPPEQLENAASRMGERFLAHFKARNWDGMAQILADDFSQDDRRRMIGAGVRHGRDAQIADMRAIADLRTKYLTSTVMATRGERLALVRMRLAFNDEVQEGFLTDVFVIVEINSDNRFVAAISFDINDIDAAVEELDARYLAGEAAAYSQTWSVIAQTLAAFNRQDLLAGDWVTVDHRPLTLDEIDSTTTFRSAWDLTPNLHIHIEAVHQLSNFGAIVTYAAYGTSPEGFDAEWRMIMLLTVAGDRINRCEIFDEADLDAALARLDELTGKDQSK
ncbi:regulator [Mycobacterium sp. 1465703.0]|nr:BTAD domain-containing putative transcriptional regulator [Mycobacterium sp. 1465703.0]OBJ08137.1 regulator [Mycobacterium sp. 1465703.0]